MNSFTSSTGLHLTWEATEPTKQVDFLDLTITLDEDGSIFTKTYQKKMNLYLYRPPTSAQPTNILKGQIYGSIHKYYWQNTFACDFTHVATLLFHQLHRRGHSRRKLAALFLQAASRLSASHMPRSLPPAHSTTPEAASNNALLNACFLHLPFHPQDTTRQTIQRIFQQTCVPALTLPKDDFNIQRLIVAYSTAPNIGTISKKNRLDMNINTYI